MATNEIFMVSCNLERLRQVDTYHHYFSKKSNNDCTYNVILDDNRLSAEEIYKVRNGEFKFINGRIILMNDMIDFCRNQLQKPKRYDDMLNIYRVSAKLLVFIYVKRCLGIDKSFMIDDDVFILNPLDDLFKYDIAVKKDGLSNMPIKLYHDFSNVYNDIDISYCLKRSYINSGTILYTWDDDDGMENFIKKFFDEEHIYKKMLSRITDGNGIKGRYWICEQFCYSIFFYELGKVKEIYHYDNQQVCLQSTHPKNEVKPFKNPPNIIHVITRDKSPSNKHIIERLKMS